MKKAILVAGVASVVALAAVLAVPTRVELTVAAVEGADAAEVSGWVGSHGDVVSLDEESTPWTRRMGAKDLKCLFRADGDGRIRVRARVLKGPVALSEVTLVGAEISVVNRGGVLSGRAR